MSAKDVHNSNHLNTSYSRNALSKLYRLYSPENDFRPSTVKYHKKQKQEQPPVIELVFNHPHILFMDFTDNSSLKQKRAITELNIVKNIVQRKKQHNLTKKSIQALKKPMTAPSFKRRKYMELNKTTIIQSKQANQNAKINVFNFEEFSQDPKKTTPSYTFTSQYSSNRMEPKTSASKGKRYSKENNEELNIEEKKQFQKSIGRRTVDSFLSDKRKSIDIKYEQDRILREHMYQSNNSVTQMYVNMEAKFAKYVKKINR